MTTEYPPPLSRPIDVADLGSTITCALGGTISDQDQATARRFTHLSQVPAEPAAVSDVEPDSGEQLADQPGNHDGTAP